VIPCVIEYSIWPDSLITSFALFLGFILSFTPLLVFN